MNRPAQKVKDLINYYRYSNNNRELVNESIQADLSMKDSDYYG